MGQLEKYGLYVLCLVIFLILGVTIWGDGAVQPVRRGAATTGLNTSTAAPRGSEDAPTPASGHIVVPNLEALLKPAPRGNLVPPRDDKSAESGGVLNAGGGSGKTPAGTEGPKPVTTKVEPAPVAVVRPTHKVARGDTFDSIAKEKLGRASLRSEIARLNPSVRPERLQVGQVLTLPAAAELESDRTIVADASMSSVSAVAYTIGKGDTFEGIARRQLGDVKRVSELRELNPDVQPTRLRIGQKIRLPKK